ncbi:acyl-CoA dehydrogenase family protein [Streptacidiphilus sp. P02-A3a]|uniref:acyl-CoA dehydrogenase family protein n=1 Tax=Streptacidiphilus sp. P02-A3a TaxID=2704468 RepID=UPI0015F8C245|nr:acyl-CoA dehydrogenase family protein [Streptacidiphilus sp. P02-A3a]QMU67531.1 acyl-CoA dehydrogenase [Streptacidiphilus sp. P02-A3a]
MDFAFSAADEVFRARARDWLAQRLEGPDAPFADLRRTARAALAVERRRDWERELGSGGWIGIGWQPGSLTRQVVWAEEYARAQAPAPLGVIGEHLLGPTLLHHGSRAQRERFLPGIATGAEIWCQGYSEPGAGSDLAAVRTSARRDGDGWLVSGQKTWTSLSRWADRCFVLARTEPGSHRHHGLSLLLLPMDQPGRVEVRPIRQLDGEAEFSEVFFDDARADDVLGRVGDGWRVAMTLLAFERGVGMLGRQIGYARELAVVLAEAARTGAAADPVVREQLTRQWADLQVIRCNALRTLGTAEPGTAAVAKLLWGGWHQRLGELGVRVLGPAGALAPGQFASDTYELTEAQHALLFSRADTIYGGSDQIQRNLIAERVLGLPREPRPARTD